MPIWPTLIWSSIPYECSVSRMPTSGFFLLIEPGKRTDQCMNMLRAGSMGSRLALKRVTANVFFFLYLFYRGVVLSCAPALASTTPSHQLVRARWAQAGEDDILIKGVLFRLGKWWKVVEVDEEDNQVGVRRGGERRGRGCQGGGGYVAPIASSSKHTSVYLETHPCARL